MDPLLREFLGYGVIGVVVILLILGVLIPKWVVDEYRTRLAVQQIFIDKLTEAVTRLADKAEARREIESEGPG